MPLRGRASRKPRSTSASSANDTVLRDTPSIRASVRLGGNGASGGTMPETIACTTASRTRDCKVAPSGAPRANSRAHTAEASCALRIGQSWVEGVTPRFWHRRKAFFGLTRAPVPRLECVATMSEYLKQAPPHSVVETDDRTAAVVRRILDDIANRG